MTRRTLPIPSLRRSGSAPLAPAGARARRRRRRARVRHTPSSRAPTPPPGRRSTRSPRRDHAAVQRVRGGGARCRPAVRRPRRTGSTSARAEHPGGRSNEVRSSVRDLDDGSYVVTWRVIVVRCPSGARRVHLHGRHRHRVGQGREPRQSPPLAAGRRQRGRRGVRDRRFADLRGHRALRRCRRLPRLRLARGAGRRPGLAPLVVGRVAHGARRDASPASRCRAPTRPHSRSPTCSSRASGPTSGTPATDTSPRSGCVLLVVAAARWCATAARSPRRERAAGRRSPARRGGDPPPPVWSGSASRSRPACRGTREPGSQVPLVLLADAVHIAGVSLWVGALPVLAFVLLPTADLATLRQHRAARTRSSRSVCVIAIIVSGSYQSWRGGREPRRPHQHRLRSSSCS